MATDDWNWECNVSYNHTSKCPLKTPGSPAGSWYSKKSRSFTEIVDCTQGRAFAHGVVPGKQKCSSAQSGEMHVDQEAARRQAAIVHNAKSLLLKLPAELRNLIYEMCLEDEKHREINMLYRCPFSSYLFAGPESCGALTQVSQQLRRECYPNYLYRREVTVWFGDVPSYMETWLPGAAASHIKLIIEIVGEVRATGCVRPHPRGLYIDLMPILELRRQHDGFCVSILHEAPEEEQYADPTRLPDHPAKKDVRYLEADMDKILVNFEGGYLWFHFHLKELGCLEWFEEGTDKALVLKAEKRSDVMHWIDDVLVQSFKGVVGVTFFNVV